MKHQMAFYLPTRIPSYLRRLALQYDRTRTLHAEIVTSSRVQVIEETSYDGFDGGQHGHTVRLFAPFQALAKIDIREQEALLKMFGTT